MDSIRIAKNTMVPTAYIIALSLTLQKLFIKPLLTKKTSLLTFADIYYCRQTAWYPNFCDIF